jgi:hypothetical protein
MIIILGLIVVIAAVVVGVAGVLANAGSQAVPDVPAATPAA